MASLPRIATLIKASTVPCGLFLIILLLNSPSCTEAENVLYPGESLLTGNFLTYGSAYILIMQNDCNLVLYDDGNHQWSSNTAGLATNCSCSVQNDGNLVINSPRGTIWSSGSSGTGRKGNYVLVLQKDRNLAIYGPPAWTSKTNKAQITQVVAA